MYTPDGKEIEGAMDIPWEPYVTEADDGPHYFCSHACQRYFEMREGIAEVCWEPCSEEEVERRKKIIDSNYEAGNGLGSDYGPWDEEEE
ncbi:MAG: hypothetical protein SBU_000712 [Candidatus Syntrophoarchaeum butanivorans]|nr:MAG: hypothetical protein SBU_000712 [Candidatus Syntrophoarchaeum butanivorans]RJS73399.1 MAG: hypothetical protein CW694_00700 [Candidatus Syntrophoarchaeum sp. WYZ-LMO15]